MPKFFIEENQIVDKKIEIIGDDVNHIKNVLRMEIGDELTICDSDNSYNYLVKIKEYNKDKIICEILEKMVETSETNIRVDIYQGLPKADKMELVIQKSVELGVNSITPIEMKRCIVKLDNKDKIKKVERWQKIAEVAAKQSGRDIIPKINSIQNIRNIYENFKNYDIVIVAYENEKNITLKQVLKSMKQQNVALKVAIIIGPEGGIDMSEIEELQQYGAKIITLGNRILRTETVALSMLSIIMYEFEGEL